jgi:hypothetical protein
MSSSLNFSLPSGSQQLPDASLSGQNFTLPPLNNSSLPFISQNSTNPVQLTAAPLASTAWGIYNAINNTPAFDVDTCVDVKFGDVSKVSDFPVENGGFASYNKVIEAYQPKVKVAVHGDQRISVLLEQLYASVRSINLYNVLTPNITYSSVALEKYDYTRTAKDGMHMVQVEITLKQINQVTTTYSAVKLPKPAKAHAGDKNANGKVVTAPAPTIYDKLDAYGSNLGLGNVGTGGLNGKSGIVTPPGGH